jgi:hypothetical protein
MASWRSVAFTRGTLPTNRIPSGFGPLTGCRWRRPASCELRALPHPLSKPRLTCKKTGRSGWLGPISKKSAAASRSNLRLHRPPLKKSAAQSRSSLRLHWWPPKKSTKPSRSGPSLHRRPLTWRNVSQILQGTCACPRTRWSRRESAKRLVQDAEGHQGAGSRNKTDRAAPAHQAGTASSTYLIGNRVKDAGLANRQGILPASDAAQITEVAAGAFSLIQAIRHYDR